MTASQDVALVRTELFIEAMTRLASGLAVVTARRSDGMPCGLLVSSICSYSVRPPSVLIAIDQSSRSYATLTNCGEFGVHLLDRPHVDIARRFAARGDDKFAGLPWSWDGTVPRLDDVPIYLNCLSSALFYHADHAVLIGAVKDGYVRPSEPLIYFRRQLDWQLKACLAVDPTVSRMSSAGERLAG